MENKKGQQLTLGTIILIVLGLVVLVFLIYGFSTGWGNLWQRITGLGGGDVNVDTIKTSCALACQQKNSYGFCVQERKVVLEGGRKATPATCKTLAADGAKVPSKNNASDKVKIGIDPCPEIMQEAECKN